MSSSGIDAKACKRQRVLQRLSLGALAVVVPIGIAHAQLPGDADCDGIVNVGDLHRLVAVIFNDPPADCTLADVNRDGRIDGADIVALAQTLNAPAPTPTPLPAGPNVVFFGLAGADGVALRSLGEIDGTPVFFRNAGFGFKIVIEAASGLNGLPPGTVTFDSDPRNPARRPDLQIESRNPLGEGSPAVCDERGVPAVDPPDFELTQSISNALNDFACNFTIATATSFACTQDAFDEPSFLADGTQVQFCLQVPRNLEIPLGDTLLSVRLRDASGNTGAVRHLTLRVAPGPAPPTFTATPTRTPTAPPTRTPTATMTRTRTRTATPRFTLSPTPTLTSSVTPVRSPSSHPSITPTPDRSTIPTATATRTRTFTRSPTELPTATPTATVPIGPVITFFGLTDAEGFLIEPSSPNAGGVRVYTRTNGAQFSLVVEGMPGPARLPVGQSAYQSDSMSFPDLQVEVSRDLGNGSHAVCDRSGPMPGGVPAIDPPSFDPIQDNIDAVNDLACRFLDGQGVPGPRSRTDDPCVKFPGSEDSGFVKLESTIQYCGFIDRFFAFPPGDTVVTVRLRDEGGNLGPPAQLMVHVGL